MKAIKRVIGLFSGASRRAAIALRAGRQFDEEFGTETVDHQRVSEMREIDQGLAAHAVHYEPSSIPKFRRAMQVLRKLTQVGLSDCSFVDVGSGKGLVVMLALQQGFSRVYGIEMAPDLHRIAKENLRRFCSKENPQGRVTLELGDALAFDWPHGNVVVYLYNPFDEVLLGRLVSRLSESMSSGVRSIIVIYVNPVHRVLFDSSSAFRLIVDDQYLVVYDSSRDERVVLQGAD